MGNIFLENSFFEISAHESPFLTHIYEKTNETSRQPRSQGFSAGERGWWFFKYCLKNVNNVIDSVDFFLISGFNFEFKMRSFVFSYTLPFQVKKMENPEILFEQEKKCPRSLFL